MSAAIHKRDAIWVSEGTRRGHQRGAMCWFDLDRHAEIRALAVKNGISFTEQVRTLVEWGLEQAKANVT